MPAPSRMPRYNVQNDGMGPYAVFYCECCDREFRSQPDIKNTLSNDVTQRVKSDLLRKVPLFGGALSQSAAPQISPGFHSQRALQTCPAPNGAQ